MDTGSRSEQDPGKGEPPHSRAWSSEQVPPYSYEGSRIPPESAWRSSQRKEVDDVGLGIGIEER